MSEDSADGHGRDAGHGDDDDHGHSHGHERGADRDVGVFDEGLPLDRRIEAFRGWLREVLDGLWHSMVEHPAFEKIEKEAEDVEDVFLFACFADAFGIPSPVSYYTAELLPYLAEEFEQWERRMWDRETLLERKGQQYHFH